MRKGATGRPRPPSATEDAQAVLGELLSFIASVVLHNAEVARAEGLGASDAQFLSLLGANGPMTAGQLAVATGLSSGTVTGVVDRLERAGFVRRDRDPGDRRKVVVVQEPEAVARLQEHYRGYGEHTMAQLARRSPEELRVIREFLRDLNAAEG